MKVLDQSFGSCADLKQLFDPISSEMSIVQLSQGPLLGQLQSFSLGGFRLTLLESNQTLFLTGTRRPKPCTISIPLKGHNNGEVVRAQGYPMPWDGMMGYNLNLKDYDLKIPGGIILATILICKEDLIQKIKDRSNSSLALKRLEITNQLEFNTRTTKQIRNLTTQLTESDGRSRRPETGDEILELILTELTATDRESLPIAQRENRHEAAIELLHWCMKHPEKHKSAEELSNLLFQSRTSLFKGCQEHFQQTMGQLQRSIRLDLARQLLLNPEKRRLLSLDGVGEISKHLGFSSRSHFAKRYEERYNELPVDTLKQQLFGNQS